jgi:hypothetical protein
VPTFWTSNPAYAQVQNEHVRQTAWAEIIQDKATPQAAAEKAFKRVEEIFSKYPIAQTGKGHRLHTRIHAQPANQFSSLKGWLATSITRAMPLDEPRKQILLDGLKDMPDGDRAPGATIIPS